MQFLVFVIIINLYYNYRLWSFKLFAKKKNQYKTHLFALKWTKVNVILQINKCRKISLIG